MTDMPEPSASRRDDRFMQVAERVADLDHPFYDEERQRDVWNEASAVGFQTILWLGLAMAGAMAWIGGISAVLSAMGVLVVIGVGSGVAIEYANRKGVSIQDIDLWGMGRTLVHSLLLVVLGAGLLRAGWLERGTDTDTLGSLVKGFAMGSGGALIAVAAVLVLAARRKRSG